MSENRFIIKSVSAREILDSRGNPTVEVEVRTPGGFGRASVPSGASTGTYEAVELRDGGKRFGGKGVLKACANVEGEIARAIAGMDARMQKEVDSAMIRLDGTENKARLGANAVLGASLATAKAAADASSVPLFRHLNASACVLPVPFMNIINGGKHAGNALAIQEFMIAPVGAKTFREAMRMGSEVYMALKGLLKEKYGPAAINVGDEGGFAPPITSAEDALRAIASAIKAAGYGEGDVRTAIDSAASSFYRDGKYTVDGRSLTADGLLEYYEALVSGYPIVSIEDPFEEDDYASFAAITKSVGGRVQIVGDDLFVTNMGRFRRGVEAKAANSLLLKVNQIGTLTESIDVAKYAAESGYTVMVSHRSGETEDSCIADLVVALGNGQIKTGAPARGERVAKYNQLMRIEQALGTAARYAGREALRPGGRR